MSKEDVANVLGVSSRTVEHWVNDGTLPPPAKLGNRCYWLPSLFFSWLERRLGGGMVTAAETKHAEAVSAEAAPTQAPQAATQIDAAQASKPKIKLLKRAASVDRMRAKDEAELQALLL